jgi:hypothetical protein
MESRVETRAPKLLDFVKGLSGTIHLTFEEGTQSAWLYDLLKPHVAECVVCKSSGWQNRLREDRECELKVSTGNWRVWTQW